MRFSIIIIATLTCATAASAQVTARPSGTDVPLPQGRMFLVGGSETTAHFVALDETHRMGRVIEGVVLTFYDPGFGVEDKLITQTAHLVRIDCDRKTSTEVGGSAYDAKDAPLLVLPGSDPLPLNDGLYGNVAQSFCGGMAARPGYIVQGRPAAARLGVQVRQSARRDPQASAP